MKAQLRNFDMQALYAALDAERNARGLTWAALVEEINKPFVGTPSIPISLSTVRGIASKSSVTSTVILQILRCLGRSPESFLSGAAPDAGAAFAEPGPGRVLRFDTSALHAALDAERLRRGMKWKQVAEELPGFTESMLTNLATGPLDRLSEGDAAYPMAWPSCRQLCPRS